MLEIQCETKGSKIKLLWSLVERVSEEIDQWKDMQVWKSILLSEKFHLCPLEKVNKNLLLMGLNLWFQMKCE